MSALCESNFLERNEKIMITKNQIEAGIEKGIIRFVTDPNMGSGTVCAIEDNWFYFGGLTAESEDPDAYVKNVPIKTRVEEIFDVLEDFKTQEEFIDEYRYYESVLNGTAIITEE